MNMNAYVKILANLSVSVIALDLLGTQFVNLIKYVKSKPIKEVLLSSAGSACCTERDYSRIDTCPNQYCISKIIGRLIQLIDSSRYSICLAMYSFNCYDLQKALMRAHLRGVNVKILTTNTTMSQLNKDLTALMVAGVDVRFTKYGLEKLLHHKFCLLDSDKSTNIRSPRLSKLPEEGLLLTGSMNWTMAGFCRNWDNFVITSNPALVKDFQKEFNKMWRRMDNRI